jgi:hypothetical protein
LVIGGQLAARRVDLPALFDDFAIEDAGFQKIAICMSGRPLPAARVGLFEIPGE